MEYLNNAPTERSSKKVSRSPSPSDYGSQKPLGHALFELHKKKLVKREEMLKIDQ